MQWNKIDALSGGVRSFGLRDVNAVQWLLALVQLLAICSVFVVFRIEESQGLIRLLPFVVCGFILNSLAPKQLRLPIFVAVSTAAFLMILGRHAAVFFAFAIVLVGACHLPVRLLYRSLLLFALAGGFALLRIRWESITANLVLPVLGSVFAFRLIIYVYDLEHERVPSSWWERAGYFLLLPNPCFLFFPVVDFATFRRSYYKGEAIAIYQKGLQWILRGAIQLLIYRVLYYNTPSPTQVNGFWGVFAFIVSTYLLYIRVSGQFHLIVGMLCLFGFNLPETHHNYYLASSFSDLWRRINIYWKDFMMKLFFYPVMMRLRRFPQLSTNSALVLTTAVVFVATWLLHSYQWFWLRADFPITAVDTLFWAILGVLVAINSVREARSAPKARLRSGNWSWRSAARLSFQTLGMFVFMCVLWSLWSSSSAGEWWAVISILGRSTVQDWLALGALLAAVGLAGTVFQFGYHRYATPRQNTASAASLRPVMQIAAAVVLALVGSSQWTASSLPSSIASTFQIMKMERANVRDQEAVARGYYEGLLEPARFTSALWSRRLRTPSDWNEHWTAQIVRNQSGTIIGTELKENVDTTFKRHPFRTNRWGMHDRHYDVRKGQNSVRIALLGSSYEMGGGVDFQQTYENLTEDALNAVPQQGAAYRYEILNFGVSAYSLLHNHQVFHERALRFNPDIVMYADHLLDDMFVVEVLKRVIDSRVRLPKDIETLIRKAGVEPGMDWVEVKRRFSPFAEELFEFCSRDIAQECARRGILPVWAYVPTIDETPERKARLDHHRTRAEAVGFVFISLDGAYGTEDHMSIQLAPWDSHPNVRGHRLLAQRLLRELMNHPSIRPRLQPGKLAARSRPAILIGKHGSTTN